MRKKKIFKAIIAISLIVIAISALSIFAFAEADVAGSIEKTWTETSKQVKTVVNNVVFPIIDVILGVMFFIKLAMAYFDYKRHNEFNWQAPAILFACLVLSLTAPTYIWQIVGVK